MERIEQMISYMKEKEYQKAIEIAEQVDWKKVKNVSMLCAASEIFEYNKDYAKSQDILMLAYEKAPESKKIIYRLSSLALKMGDVQEASECYDEFVKIAPKDPNQYILRYKILENKGAPIEQQIDALENFKKVEYTEKWAYQLAKLYEKAGMITECIEECDDLDVWFSDGKYVVKAMELKKQYKPLTPMQEEKYLQRTGQEDKGNLEKEEVVEAKPEEIISEENVPEEKVSEEKVSEEIVSEENVPEENVSEEQAPEVVEDSAENEEQVDDREVEDEQVEPQKSPTSGLSIQEILQDWEEKQKENAQIIQAEQERVQAELEEQEAEKEPEEEEESIIPDDIRQLMEQLESESSEIQAQKVVQEPENPVNVIETENAGEVLKKTEKETGIQLGDTQKIMNAAKALFNEEIEEPREVFEEKPPVSLQDTGFVVQGRYDLEAQSEIGLKAGLTEEQKRLFSYFVPVHGMSEQLVEVLENDKQCRTRYGTSRTGNVVIIGRKGSGKTVLAANIVRAIQKERNVKHGKIAIVKAEAMNQKDISKIVEKLKGGALVVEKASRLNRKSATQLSDLMEEQTGEMLVILEDERKSIEKMFEANPRFAKKFTSKIELPVFINDELVTFGQTYAKENGFKIDDMGILALYSHIDRMQREETAVTVAAVKELVDRAIENSKKMNVKHFLSKVIGKARDEANRVILTEDDFKW